MARSYTIRFDDKYEALHESNSRLLEKELNLSTNEVGKSVRQFEARELLSNITLKELERRPKGASTKEGLKKFLFSHEAWQKNGTTYVESFAPIYRELGFALKEIKNDMAPLEGAEIVESTS